MSLKIKDVVSYNNTEIAFQSKNDRDLNWAYILFSVMNNPFIVQVGKIFLQFAMMVKLPVRFMIKNTIFKQFCGGETMEESNSKTEYLAKYNVRTILDYSVEGKENDAEFDKSAAIILKTIENAATHKHIPFGVFKMTGMARFDLLQKVTEGQELNDDEQAEFDRIVERVNRICKKGFELNVPVMIDAEESWIQGAVDQICEDMMDRYNKQKAIIFNTVQLYRHDRLAYLNKSIDEARAKGQKYGIKLVRGAYLEKERERAKKKGYQDPTNKTKEDTDRDFDGAIKACIDNIDIVSVVCGTHNEKSCHYLEQLMEEKGLARNDERVYFSQLLGMSDHISFNLSHEGYNVAKYLPFGPVYDVTPYLIRRTEENTSIAGQSSRELSLIKQERTRRKSA